MGETLIARLKLNAALEGALFVVRIDARSKFLQFRCENLVIENVERSLRLGDGDFRFAARENGHPAMSWILQTVRGYGAENRSHHHGNANIGIARHFRAVKSGGSD